MQDEQPLGGFRRDCVTLVGERRREPGRLTRAFVVVHIDLASARVEDHEPDQPGAHDEPDDEQPPVEFRVHRAEV